MKYLILVVMVFVVGCSSVSTGRVYDKSYKGEIAQERNTLTNGFSVSELRITPESYRLLIQSDKGKGYCSVNKEQYEYIQIGQMVSCE